MTNDIDLLRRYVTDGSEEAFTEITRRHIDFVYGAALRQARNPHRAEDVTQAVFTDLARKAATLLARTELVGWLYISTRYAATSVVRSEARREAREREAQMIQETSSQPAEKVDWQSIDPVLDAALSELDEADRAALLLRFFKNHSFAEIGEVLRVSEEAARKRTDRALAKLRTALAHHGVTSTAAAITMALANSAAVAAPAGLVATVASAALAGAAAAGAASAAATTGLFVFMNTSKIIVAVAAGIAALAITASIHEATRRTEAESAIAVVTRERDSIQKELAESNRRAATSQAESARLNSRVATLESPAKGVDPALAVRSMILAKLPTQMGYILEHPELRARYAEQTALQTRLIYSRFFQTAGLSPDDQEKFIKLRVERKESMLDTLDVLNTQGLLDPAKTTREQVDAVQQTLAEHDARADAEMKALLGNDKFSQLAQFSQTKGEQVIASQLVGMLYFTDSPLDPQQADKVVQALAANKYAPSRNNEPSQANTIAGTVVSPAMALARMQDTQQETDNKTSLITDAAISQAERLLTPRQLAALKSIQTQQLIQVVLAPPLKGLPERK